MEQYLKISGFYKLISIEPTNENHTIRYVSLTYGSDRTPRFAAASCTLNLTQVIRDKAISEILTIKNEKEQFQLDESLLTQDQIEKLDKLRNVQSLTRWYSDVVRECKVDWANQFKVGDRVNFNGNYGIITFKHEMKSKDPQEWTVRSNGVEYRYVSGALLTINKKQDLSMIEVDKELDKLSTIKLLKMYKSSLKRGRGLGNRKIKRILYDREDLTNKNPSKIVNYR